MSSSSSSSSSTQQRQEQQQQQEQEQSRPPQLTSECTRCIRYLRDALSLPSSKSKALLDSMRGEIAWTENGAKIELNPPVATTAVASESESNNVSSQKFDVSDKVVSDQGRIFQDGVVVATAATAAPSTRPETVAVVCRPCGTMGPEGGARAFVQGPSPISAVLCSNRLNSAKDVEEVLVHEFIHLYDIKVKGLDLRDCHQLAYSEIRAAREAECAQSWGEWSKSMCTHTRAATATRNLFPKEGGGCVKQAFTKAMADLTPFPRLSKENEHILGQRRRPLYVVTATSPPPPSSER